IQQCCQLLKVVYFGIYGHKARKLHNSSQLMTLFLGASGSPPKEGFVGVSGSPTFVLKQNTSTTTHWKNIFIMSNCNVTFYKKTDGTKGTDGYKNYDGPQSVADLSKVLWEGTTFANDMKDDISWVDTSSQTWVRVYSKTNFQGRTALIGPNQHVSMKTLYDENKEGTMDDTIE